MCNRRSCCLSLVRRSQNLAVRSGIKHAWNQHGALAADLRKCIICSYLRNSWYRGESRHKPAKPCKVYLSSQFWEVSESTMEAVRLGRMAPAMENRYGKSAKP